MERLSVQPFRIHDLRQIVVRLAPDPQELGVGFPRRPRVALPCQRQSEMIVGERVARVEPQHAPVFDDGLVEASQLQVGVGQTIPQGVQIPAQRAHLECFTEPVDGLVRVTGTQRQSTQRPV